jgi:3-carboxy-cis,cis-muconate cycloisomerase
MRRNIDAQQGLVFAEGLSMRLARAIGKAGAHQRVEAWSRRAVAERRHLREVAHAGIAADEDLRAHVAGAEVDALFDADAAARHASAPARAQLERLARHAALQRDGAPWDAWRPDEGADEDDKETE